VRRWTLAGSLALACSEESAIREADVADVCNEPGPVQILTLEREEVVGEAGSSARYGDRYLYGIRTFDHPISNVGVTRAPAAQRGYAELDARIESIDRCGDDRRVVAEGVDSIFVPRNESEPWLGRRSETGMLFWIDPEGRWSARELVETRFPGTHIVTERVVHFFRDDEHDIVSITLEGDAPVVETVLDRVVDAQTFSAFRDVDASALVYALRDDGELVLIDLRSGRMESIAKGVAGFTTDRDPRWVAWWPGVHDEVLPPPVTEGWLVDRMTGGTQALAFDDAAELSMRLFGPLLTTWQHGPGLDPSRYTDILQTRLTFLPRMRSYVLPGKWDSAGSSAVGDRFTAQAPFEVASGWVLFESTEASLAAVAGPFTSSGDDAFWTEECDGHVRSAHAEPCDLIRIPFETAQREIAERGAWSSIALPDDHWLKFVGRTPPPDAWRPDPRGTLWIIDGTTGDETRLDRDVSPGLYNLEPHELGREPWHTNEVVYQVRSLDTDRTGLWRARFE
jgi:hypothetical protein